MSYDALLIGVMCATVLMSYFQIVMIWFEIRTLKEDVSKLEVER